MSAIFTLKSVFFTLRLINRHAYRVARWAARGISARLTVLSLPGMRDKTRYEQTWVDRSQLMLYHHAGPDGTLPEPFCPLEATSSLPPAIIVVLALHPRSLSFILSPPLHLHLQVPLSSQRGSSRTCFPRLNLLLRAGPPLPASG